MKTRTLSYNRRVCLLICAYIFHSVYATAQCSSSNMRTLRYDTLVTGSGNDMYNFSFPQLDPAAGTLASVSINATVSLNYGFTLTNRDAATSNFIVKVGREDYYTSDALLDPYDNTIYTRVATYNLAGGASTSKPISNIVYRNSSVNNVTGDVAGFLGSGQVSFNYQPATFTDLVTTASYSYSATANDTTRFSVTYTYCSATILGTGLTNFIATLKDASTVKLVWTAVNETAGLSYEVQKSANGTDFTDLTAVPAQPDSKGTGKYGYDYAINGNDHDKLYFRLKITKLDGSTDYSTVKIVEWKDPAGTPSVNTSFTISPNPAVNYINLAFNQPSDDWQIDIISASGSLIQRNTAHHTNYTRIEFNHQLAAGVYFVRATNLKTQRNSVSSFVAR